MIDMPTNRRLESVLFRSVKGLSYDEIHDMINSDEYEKGDDTLVLLTPFEIKASLRNTESKQILSMTIIDAEKEEIKQLLENLSVLNEVYDIEFEVHTINGC